jgi:hypothetical protein
MTHVRSTACYVGDGGESHKSGLSEERIESAQ